MVRHCGLLESVRAWDEQIVSSFYHQRPIVEGHQAQQAKYERIVPKDHQVFEQIYQILRLQFETGETCCVILKYTRAVVVMLFIYLFNSKRNHATMQW